MSVSNPVLREPQKPLITAVLDVFAKFYSKKVLKIG